MSTSTQLWGGGDFLLQFNGQSSLWSDIVSENSWTFLVQIPHHALLSVCLMVGHCYCLVAWWVLPPKSKGWSRSCCPWDYPLLMSDDLGTGDRWPASRERGMSKVRPAQFGLMNQKNSGSRAHGIGLTSNLSQCLCEVQYFGNVLLILSLFHHRCLSPGLVARLVVARTSHSYHWTDGVHWLLFPAFML